MFLEIYQALDKFLSNEDYHHFDSICYIGLHHSFGLYILICFSFLLYIHQSQTIMNGLSEMRIKKVWPLMRNDNICALFLTLTSAYPLFLDIHLLRINLFIALIFYVVDRTTAIFQKLPYFRILIVDLGCLFFVEIMHLLCLTTTYKICRIFIEVIRLMLWLIIVKYKQQTKTEPILYLSVALQFFWVYIYIFQN